MKQQGAELEKEQDGHHFSCEVVPYQRLGNKLRAPQATVSFIAMLNEAAGAAASDPEQRPAR
jgi:hypothetical protein